MLATETEVRGVKLVGNDETSRGIDVVNGYTIARDPSVCSDAEAGDVAQARGSNEDFVEDAGASVTGDTECDKVPIASVFSPDAEVANNPEKRMSTEAVEGLWLELTSLDCELWLDADPDPVLASDVVAAVGGETDDIIVEDANEKADDVAMEAADDGADDVNVEAADDGADDVAVEDADEGADDVAVEDADEDALDEEVVADVGELEVVADVGELEVVADVGELEVVADVGELEVVADVGELEVVADVGELEVVADVGELELAEDDVAAELLELDLLVDEDDSEKKSSNGWLCSVTIDSSDVRVCPTKSFPEDEDSVLECNVLVLVVEVAEEDRPWLDDELDDELEDDTRCGDSVWPGVTISLSMMSDMFSAPSSTETLGSSDTCKTALRTIE
ncbi:hypothetical protein GGI22_002947 [Coemansia erecta]|nr:hypothetical protein GGI22_002947 [Coemansia erecta]